MRSAHFGAKTSEFPCGPSWTAGRELRPKSIAWRENITSRWTVRSPGAEGGIPVAVDVQPRPRQESCSQKSLVGTPPNHPSGGKASNCAPATAEEIIRLQVTQATKVFFINPLSSEPGPEK